MPGGMLSPVQNSWSVEWLTVYVTTYRTSPSPPLPVLPQARVQELTEENAALQRPNLGSQHLGALNRSAPPWSGTNSLLPASAPCPYSAARSPPPPRPIAPISFPSYASTPSFRDSDRGRSIQELLAQMDQALHSNELKVNEEIRESIRQRVLLPESEPEPEARRSPPPHHYGRVLADLQASLVKERESNAVLEQRLEAATIKTEQTPAEGRRAEKDSRIEEEMQAPREAHPVERGGLQQYSPSHEAGGDRVRLEALEEQLRVQRVEIGILQRDAAANAGQGTMQRRQALD